MNPISAPVQKPAPRSERDLAPSRPEADLPDPPGAERRHGFGAALREASGTPAASRNDATGDASADADAPAGKSDPAGAGAPPEETLPKPVDPAAALLANLWNTALPGAAAGAAPPTFPALGAGDGASTVGGANASVRHAAATGATAGSGPTLDGGPLTANARAARGDVQPGAAPAGATLRDAPEVAVLDRAVHFKPVVANGPAPDPAAPATAQAAKPQPIRAALPDLVATAAKSAPKIQPQPEGAPADAAPPGPDMTDRTTLEDIRAITGIAWAALEPDGRTTSEDRPEPGSRAGAGASLPAAAFTTIAAAIRDAVDRAAEAAPETRIPADPSVRSAPDGPLRTLRIQLRPEDLGTVTVELRLTNGQLETHLRASRPETAALLHRDTAILTDLLKQAHYQAEVTVGQSRPSEGNGSSGGFPSQGQPSASDGGARPGQGGERQRQAEQNRQVADRRDGERTDETVRPRDSGVYL